MEVKCCSHNQGTQKGMSCYKELQFTKFNYDYVFSLYYVFNSTWPMSFISSNEHKDNSIYKLYAQFNVLKICEK